MSSQTAIPVLSYGRHAHIATAVAEGLKPEYDVVHVCLSLDAALSEIPNVVAGVLSAEPASGLGSNVGRGTEERLAPKAVLFGGGIPPEEVQQVKDAVHAKGADTKWIKVDGETLRKLGGPSAEKIVPILRDMLKDADL